MSISNFLQMFKQPPQEPEGSSATIILPNGAKYTGTLENGKPEGRGTLIYNNNERYEGEFHLGMKHGKGKYYYLKGQLYIGDWSQNKKHGKGQYFYENGNRYTGEFHNNMKHGYGRIDEDCGTYYQGYFKQNNKDRTGEFYNAITEKKYVQVYTNAKLVTQSEIIEGIQVNEDEAPEDLLKKLSRKIRPSIPEEYREFISEEQVRILPQESNMMPLQQCNSQCEPLMPSLRHFQSKLRSQDSHQPLTLIAQNYFSQALLGKKISLWTKDEVSSWLNQIGFGDCIDQFRENNIEGDTLLVLDNNDLKQLNVGALGDRRIFQRQIEFLRLIMKSQCLGDSISKFYEQAITLELVRELQQKKMQREDLKKQVVKAVEIDSSSSTSSDDEKSKIKSRGEINSKYTRKMRKQKSINMQSKVENYLQKKGIKLTFLIPKEQIEIIRPIGRGGYGQVFEGKWLGQPVAVKKYLKKQGFRNKHVGHFIEEVQVINKLLHPSIVLYMGMCIYDNQYGMVTEFMKGGSLFDYLHKSRRSLTEENIFYILKDVALGMSYLHGKNVLHCDLKSSNVLIDESWNVKLCDFGLSRIQTTTKSKRKSIRVGTPHWMAPQILKGEKYQFESDVYSFGILLWEMLTGQIPYKDLSTAQIIGLVGNDDKHRIAMPKSTTQLFMDIFLLCTERDSKIRPSFKHIVNLLEKQEYRYDTDENEIVIAEKPQGNTF